MVSLRSQDKQAATGGDPSSGDAKKATSVSAGRTARRSLTPDRASQDSTIRRSQRLKDRQGVLESIQEDTAASAGKANLKYLQASRWQGDFNSCQSSHSSLSQGQSLHWITRFQQQLSPLSLQQFPRKHQQGTLLLYLCLCQRPSAVLKLSRMLYCKHQMPAKTVNPAALTSLLMTHATAMLIVMTTY